MTRSKHLKLSEDVKHGKPIGRLKREINVFEEYGKCTNCRKYIYNPTSDNDPDGCSYLSSLEYISVQISTCKNPGCVIENWQMIGDNIIVSCSCPEENRQFSYRFHVQDLLIYPNGICESIPTTRTRILTNSVSYGVEGGVSSTNSDYVINLKALKDNNENTDMNEKQRYVMLMILVILGNMFDTKTRVSSTNATQRDMLMLTYANILGKMPDVKSPELCLAYILGKFLDEKTPEFLALYKMKGNGMTGENMLNIRTSQEHSSENTSEKNEMEFRTTNSSLRKKLEEKKNETSPENYTCKSHENVYLQNKSDKTKDLFDEDDEFEDKSQMSIMTKYANFSKPGNRQSSRNVGPTVSLSTNRGTKSPTIVVSNIENLRKMLRGALDKESVGKLGHGVKFLFLSHGNEDFNQGKVTLIPFYGIEINNLDMSNYFNRLSTYYNWPTDSLVSSLKLASAGFIYRGNNQTVECFSCGLSISDFPVDSSPLEIHQYQGNDCAFLRSLGLHTSGREISNTTNNASSREVLPINPELNQNIDHRVSNVATQFEESLNLTRGQNTQTYRTNGVIGSENYETLPEQIQENIQLETDNLASEKGSIVAQASGYSSLNHYSSESLYSCLPSNLKTGAIATHDRERNNISNTTDWSRNDDNILGSAKHIQYSTIGSRLESFKSWSHNSIQQPRNLVDAGFYYIGKEDIVRCFFCDIGLAEWAADDDPWVEHARHSPQCLYVKLTRGEEFIENIQSSWRRIYCPKHQQYEQYTDRLQTFINWPSTITQRPEQLASAGFFYTGEDDTVRCHYCDGGLRQWEPDDIPWTEHARWFPYCKFVIKIKGISFIEEISRAYNEMYSTQHEIQNGTTTNTTVNHEGILRSKNNVSKCQNALSTTAAQSVLDMGYSSSIVKSAINEYIKRTGNREFMASDIMEIIFQFDESSTERGKLRISTGDEKDLCCIKNLDFEKLGSTNL